MKPLSKGFSLVELVIAMVVISILAGFIIVQVGSARKRTMDLRVQADMEMLNAAKGSWQIDHVGQAFPSDESGRYLAIKPYFDLNHQYTTLSLLQPPGVLYAINDLGQPATHAP